MANLGSDNTPIKGENFSLPAGAQIDEDDGDFVIRDSGGSIMLRRDEANDAWDFVSTDLKGITSLETEKIRTTNVVGEAGNSSSQNIGNDIFTTVELDSNKETSNVVNVDLSNNRIQIIEDGTYLCVAQVDWDPDAQWSDGDEMLTRVTVDGVQSDFARAPHTGASNNFTPPKAMAIVSASGTTNVELEVRQQSGGEVSTAGNDLGVWLKVMRMG